MNHESINPATPESPVNPEEGLPLIRIRRRLDEYPHGQIPPRRHSEFLFGLVLTGELDACLLPDPEQPVSMRLAAGDGFFLNSGASHRFSQRAPGTELFLFGIIPGIFAAPLFGGFYAKTILPVLHSQLSGLFFTGQEPEDRPLLALFQECFRLSPQDPDWELRNIALLCQIWILLAGRIRALQNTPLEPPFQEALAGRIRGMVRFIQRHYAESLTVDQIAQAGGVSRRECFRRFRNFLHESPVEFLNHYRLSQAASLLTNTDQTLAQISESSGFENVSYFIKRFRRQYGVSPRQFRE